MPHRAHSSSLALLGSEVLLGDARAFSTSLPTCGSDQHSNWVSIARETTSAVQDVLPPVSTWRRVFGNEGQPSKTCVSELFFIRYDLRVGLDQAEIDNGRTHFCKGLFYVVARSILQL